MRHRIAIRLMAAAGWILPVAGQGAVAAPKTHTVTMAGTRFQPAELTIRAGDTVVWVNDDIVPHTATAQDKRFDSGTIQPGKSWKYRFRQKGVFPYICTIHPTMKGNLRVE